MENKEDILDLAALKYAEKVKKVNKTVIDAWINGFCHCDKTLGLEYQLQEYKNQLQDYVDNWEERAGYSDARGDQWTRMRERAKDAKELLECIERLEKDIDKYETKI